MKILSVKPGHDGCVAFVADGILIFSIEAEKDSFRRYSNATGEGVIAALEIAPAMPDVVAISGWHKVLPGYDSRIGAGYYGLDEIIVRPGSLLGHPVTFFSSSHERSHIFMATSMFPGAPVEECVILVWEGRIGSFYHWQDSGKLLTRYEVMSQPGARYSGLFALADPVFPDFGRNCEHEYAGKLMALAAYGNNAQLRAEDRSVVDRLLREETFYPFAKGAYRDCSLYNAGVEDEHLHAAARYITDRIFEKFRDAARAAFRPGLPLLISGGCGLNCDWNRRWSELQLFTEVNVLPCTNDSGSAIGTAADAMTHFGETCRLDWSVYSGPPFVHDITPPESVWARYAADPERIAMSLVAGEIVAWIQGRCEIGPRALGHRSMLASAIRPEARTQLNLIKGREDYRPIAPCCRSEELAEWFDPPIDDPYMLFFSRVRTNALPAITHVDGTARVQSVNRRTAPELHDLLGVMRSQSGYGVLCNTSLNFEGCGFINRTTELLRYCDDRGLDNIVIDDDWYRRRTPAARTWHASR